MKVLAADDEPLALDMLTEAIRTAIPDARTFAFMKPSQLLSHAEKDACEIAFLDINMRGMTGIALAKKLKDANPKINIIFVTGYDEYTKDAMALHASGYIMKPVTAGKIKEELSELRHPVKPHSEKLLGIKCFGNFDAFSHDGEIIHFERSKSKEVLAYLVYRAGASCSIKELAAALFEDTEYDRNQRGYVQKIVSSLIQTLKKYAAESVILKNYNSLAIDISQVDCDYYKFAEMESVAVNSYSGEFMAQYPWAEFVIGYLEEMYWKNNDRKG